jgi:hypothetical protein
MAKRKYFWYKKIKKGYNNNMKEIEIKCLVTGCVHNDNMNKTCLCQDVVIVLKDRKPICDYYCRETKEMVI